MSSAPPDGPPYSAIRVLVTANAMLTPPGSRALSGGDKRFIEIFKRLAHSRNFQIELMTSLSGADIVRREGMADVPIHYLPSLWARSFFGIAVELALRMCCAVVLAVRLRSRYDVIYTTTDILTDTLPAFLLRSIGRRASKWVGVVFHLIPRPSQRAGSWTSNLPSFAQQRLSHYLMRRADLIVVDNTFVKQGLVGRRLEERKIRVAPAGGVDWARIEAAGLAEEKFDAIFIGRLQPSKGIFDLPEIWAKVCERLPGLRLGIIGSGPADYPARLAKAFAAAGLSQNAELLGSPSTDELYSLLKSSRIFVFPSYEEGWGIAACEAMAFSLPVVAYDLPVYAEVFHGAVQIVPLNDRAAFADKIVEILSNPSLRQSIIERSVAVASQYTWERLAKEEGDILISVASSK